MSGANASHSPAYYHTLREREREREKGIKKILPAAVLAHIRNILQSVLLYVGMYYSYKHLKS